MSDATLLPPRRLSSAAPAMVARVLSDSSSGEGDFETCLEQSASYIPRGEGSGGSEGRAENKQKRKRTRYVCEGSTYKIYIQSLVCPIHYRIFQLYV